MPASTRPMTSSTPRVAIVDADRRVQQSLSDLLGIDGELEVVGTAGDVRSALELVEASRPDAVLLDPRLPDLEAGIALMRGLGTAWPELRIVLTGWNDVEGHAVGGEIPCAYVSKGGSPEEFVEAIVRCCAVA